VLQIQILWNQYYQYSLVFFPFVKTCFLEDIFWNNYVSVLLCVCPVMSPCTSVVSQLHFYLVTYIYSGDASPSVAFTDPDSHPCRCLFHSLVSMAMLGTKHVFTVYFPHNHLLLGQMKGVFFCCGTPAVLLRAEVMGLLLFTIKIMKYLNKRCV
jgi:hypothetical protein